MQKARDIIGLPVIAVAGGKQVGTVKDMLFDEEWRIEGLLLEEKHWFSSPRWVAWPDIKASGPDAVTIAGEEALRTLDDTEGKLLLFGGKRKLVGLPIVTVNGRQLGIVEDVYFAAQLDRKVIGCELSDGLLADLREGRKFLPLGREAVVGEDAIIVPAAAERELSETGMDRDKEILG